MKPFNRLVAVLASAALSCAAHAGTIFYVPVPGTGSDAGSGITDADDYTTLAGAAAAGNDETVLNGMAVQQLEIAGAAATTTGLTFSADTGTLVNGGGAVSVPADGVIATLLSKRIFNDGATDGSEQYIVLDSATLQAGATYDLRIYMANGGGQQRWVNLAFVGDGLDPVETDFFNEDDATTSPGAFTSADQVYYIDYRFTWDGATDPGVTITQRSGAAPFVLYLVANRVMPAAATPAPTPQRALTLTSRSRKRGPAGGAPAPAPGAGAEPIAAVDQIGTPAREFVDAPALQQAGSWVDLEGVGPAWQPSNANLPPDWSPYTRGQWVNSEEDGWTFVSDPAESDWAEITNHYGRYVNIADRGWFWRPGTEWAGAWVSWREGPDYLGWAPLPPDVPYGGDVGISTWVDAVYGLGPSIYNFVPIAQFGVPNVSNVLIDRSTSINIFNQTTNITNVTNNRTFINNRYVNNVYNGGPQLAAVNNYINKRGGTPISTVHVNKVSATDLKGHPGGIKNGVLTAATPPLHPGGQVHGPKVAKPIVDKGWTGVKDPAQAAAAKKAIAAQAKGQTPQTHPAHPPQLAGTPGKQPAKKPGAPTQHPGGALVDKPAGAPSTQPVAGAKKPGGPAATHPQGNNVPNALAGPNAGQPPRPGVKRPGGPVAPAAGAPSAASNKGKRPGTTAAATTAGTKPAALAPPKPGVKRPGQITAGPNAAATHPTPGGKAPGPVAQQPAGAKAQGSATQQTTAAQAPLTRGAKKPGQKTAGAALVTPQVPSPTAASSTPLVDAPSTARTPGTGGKRPGSTTRPPTANGPATTAAGPTHGSAPLVDAPPTTRPPASSAPVAAAAPTTRGKKGGKTPAASGAPAVASQPPTAPHPAPQAAAPQPKPQAQAQHPQPKSQPQAQVQHPQPKPQAQAQVQHPQPKPQPQAQVQHPQPKPQPQAQVQHQPPRPQPQAQVQHQQPRPQPQPQVQHQQPRPQPQPQVARPQPQVARPQPQVARPQPQVARAPVAQPAAQQPDPRKKKPYGY